MPRTRLPRRLRYVDDSGPGLRRRARGKNFVYTDARGRPVSNAKTIARIRSLAIPPAYTDVWISPHDNGHIQATGRDARGRKQYRYHAEWRSFRDAEKFADLTGFGRALTPLRKGLARDLRRPELDRRKVLAIVVSLLDRTMIRVGNDEYARKNSSYGLTTMRARHVQVKGREVEFKFRGKSGKHHAIALADARLARLVKGCMDLPGQRLFQYYAANGRVASLRSNDVNDYLREISARDLTAKHFRTWGATVGMYRCWYDSLAAEPDLSPRERYNRCVASVAARLGNTPTICRKSYIHPGVAAALESGDLGPISGPVAGKLDQTESALLRYLRTLRA